VWDKTVRYDEQAGSGDDQEEMNAYLGKMVHKKKEKKEK
jgi:hypothetical protein